VFQFQRLSRPSVISADGAVRSDRHYICCLKLILGCDLLRIAGPSGLSSSSESVVDVHELMMTAIERAKYPISTELQCCIVSSCLLSITVVIILLSRGLLQDWWLVRCCQAGSNVGLPPLPAEIYAGTEFKSIISSFSDENSLPHNKSAPVLFDAHCEAREFVKGGFFRELRRLVCCKQQLHPHHHGHHHGHHQLGRTHFVHYSRRGDSTSNDGNGSQEDSEYDLFTLLAGTEMSDMYNRDEEENVEAVKNGLNSDCQGNVKSLLFAYCALQFACLSRDINLTFGSTESLFVADVDLLPFRPILSSLTRQCMCASSDSTSVVGNRRMLLSLVLLLQRTSPLTLCDFDASEAVDRGDGAGCVVDRWYYRQNQTKSASDNYKVGSSLLSTDLITDMDNDPKIPTAILSSTFKKLMCGLIQAAFSCLCALTRNDGDEASSPPPPPLSTSFIASVLAAATDDNRLSNNEILYIAEHMLVPLACLYGISSVDSSPSRQADRVHTLCADSPMCHHVIVALYRHLLSQHACPSEVMLRVASALLRINAGEYQVPLQQWLQFYRSNKNSDYMNGQNSQDSNDQTSWEQVLDSQGVYVELRNPVLSPAAGVPGGMIHNFAALAEEPALLLRLHTHLQLVRSAVMDRNAAVSRVVPFLINPAICHIVSDIAYLCSCVARVSACESVFVRTRSLSRWRIQHAQQRQAGKDVNAINSDSTGKGKETRENSVAVVSLSAIAASNATVTADGDHEKNTGSTTSTTVTSGSDPAETTSSLSASGDIFESTLHKFEAIDSQVYIELQELLILRLAASLWERVVAAASGHGDGNDIAGNEAIILADVCLAVEVQAIVRTLAQRLLSRCPALVHNMLEMGVTKCQFQLLRDVEVNIYMGSVGAAVHYPRLAEVVLRVMAHILAETQHTQFYTGKVIEKVLQHMLWLLPAGQDTVGENATNVSEVLNGTEIAVVTSAEAGLHASIYALLTKFLFRVVLGLNSHLRKPDIKGVHDKAAKLLEIHIARKHPVLMMEAVAAANVSAVKGSDEDKYAMKIWRKTVLSYAAKYNTPISSAGTEGTTGNDSATVTAGSTTTSSGIRVVTGRRDRQVESMECLMSYVSNGVWNDIAFVDPTELTTRRSAATAAGNSFFDNMHKRRRSGEFDDADDGTASNSRHIDKKMKYHATSKKKSKRRKQRAEYEDDDDDDIVDDIDEVGDIDEDNDDDDDNGEHSQHHYKSKRLRIKAENPSSQTLPAMEDRRYDDNDEEM
jgi:hypothetical protein